MSGQKTSSSKYGERIASSRHNDLSPRQKQIRVDYTAHMCSTDLIRHGLRILYMGEGDDADVLNDVEPNVTFLYRLRRSEAMVAYMVVSFDNILDPADLNEESRTSQDKPCVLAVANFCSSKQHLQIFMPSTVRHGDNVVADSCRRVFAGSLAEGITKQNLEIVFVPVPGTNDSGNDLLTSIAAYTLSTATSETSTSSSVTTSARPMLEIWQRANILWRRTLVLCGAAYDTSHNDVLNSSSMLDQVLHQHRSPVKILCDSDSEPSFVDKLLFQMKNVQRYYKFFQSCFEHADLLCIMAQEAHCQPAASMSQHHLSGGSELGRLQNSIDCYEHLLDGRQHSPDKRALLEDVLEKARVRMIAVQQRHAETQTAVSVSEATCIDVMAFKEEMRRAKQAFEKVRKHHAKEFRRGLDEMEQYEIDSGWTYMTSA